MSMYSAKMDSETNDESSGQKNQTNNKNNSPLFNLWPKRSTKVEPHPVLASLSDTHINIENNIQKSDLSFAKCSPKKRTKQSNQHVKYFEHHSDQETPTSKLSPVVFRKKTTTKSNNNNNNNRFSHQFSLCCKLDRKPSTPPPSAVTVRYNSIPDVITAREKLLLSLTATTDTAPLAEVSECNSAPETPINNKTQAFQSHSPPLTSSSQSIKSNNQFPNSIAMSACRSRLRLKLLPPSGKAIINLNQNKSEAIPKKENNFNVDRELVMREQHMSSPNLPLQDEIPIDLVQNTRSMSHEDILHDNSSNSDLAKQTLIAAQVLNLIPIEKARERNYLANRLACSSLLGTSELIRILPNKEISIFVGSWNMNGQSPPKQINDFVLPASVEHVPDLVAIGTQESCPERFEWEVTLQETLGPSHVLFHSANLGTLHLAIFLRRDLIWFCSVPEEASLSVRPGTAFRTKGAVAISFCLFGTSMLFVTSHLTAHQQKVKERVQDVKRITHALDLPKNLNIRHKNKDVTQNFDSVFWCGDLNFRLAEPREKILEWIEKTKFPLPAHLPHGYMHTDQLSSVLNDGAAFKGFMESKITFPPTYKYDPGTQHFDTSSKQRAPAYTDRILFKYRSPSVGMRRASAAFLTRHAAPLECIAYDSVPSIISSDHKPVWALFKNTIKPGIDSIPLAAGLFVRDVYVEGMRRRLNNNYSGSSAVCSIQ